MKNGLSVVFTLVAMFLGKLVIAGPSCQTGQLISQTFTNGAQWALCWEHSSLEGILLKDLFFTTPAGLERKVLKEASLAQIHVAFDDGSLRVYHISEYGLGGNNLENLHSTQCQNGQRLMVGSIHALCQRVEDRSYLFKDSGTQKQAQLLDLYSQSNTDGYTWLVRWQLYDDGTIEPLIGVTGALNNFGSDTSYGDETGVSGTVAVAAAINYFWRLDFDIAGNGANDVVEEFNVTPTNNGSNKSLSISRLTTETGRQLDMQLKRSWRVRDGNVTNNDGHPVSYHLEALHAGYNYSGRSDEPWAGNDFYVTQNNSCERLIENNSTTGGCAAGLTNYINGQNTDGADIVIWYGLTYHHFPRDEDLPYIPTHWDGFQLLPRDWTATSPVASN